ncbi:MAG: hypothetical protein GX127_02165 [Eubacteriaceae bacterium]|jgi:hypothetical protein|nr:hypothetical protein [Eubacteriaceae bacterium]
MKALRWSLLLGGNGIALIGAFLLLIYPAIVGTSHQNEDSCSFCTWQGAPEDYRISSLKGDSYESILLEFPYRSTEIEVNHRHIKDIARAILEQYKVNLIKDGNNEGYAELQDDHIVMVAGSIDDFIIDVSFDPVSVKPTRKILDGQSRADRDLRIHQMFHIKRVRDNRYKLLEVGSNLDLRYMPAMEHRPTLNLTIDKN